MGNVLIRFSHDRMRRQLADATGLTVEAVRELLLEGALFSEYDRGTVDDSAVVERFERRAGRRLDPTALLRAMSDIFWPMEGMAEVVRSLKTTGHRLVLLSNTCRPHIEFVRREFPQVLAPFDAVVLSYEVRALKPEDRIFEAAKERIECAPEHCFYTDDIGSYIDAGRKQGFQGSIFTGVTALVAELAERGIAVDQPPLPMD
jgi:putative hydrolase of the HAD superfamily